MSVKLYDTVYGSMPVEGLTTDDIEEELNKIEEEYGHDIQYNTDVSNPSDVKIARIRWMKLKAELDSREIEQELTNNLDIEEEQLDSPFLQFLENKLQQLKDEEQRMKDENEIDYHDKDIDYAEMAIDIEKTRIRDNDVEGK